MKISNRTLLRYVPPGSHNTMKIEVGHRQLDLINALRHGPSTRMDLLLRGRPRLALNATALIAQLRKKGVEIDGRWESGLDGDGGRTRFMRYQLTGRVLGTSRK